LNLLAKRLDKRFIGVCLFASQTVIEVSDHKLPIELPTQLPKHMEERQRIWTARYTDNDGLVGLKHLKPLNRFLHLVGYRFGRSDVFPLPQPFGDNAWGNRHQIITSCTEIFRPSKM
jgi:hypothetical protein